MKRPPCLRVVLATSFAVVLPFAQARAEGPARCTAVPVPTDSQDVTCTLDPSMRGRPLRFTAEFGGSHDDTRIKLEAKLDGEPLTCDAPSKTGLFAEDGIVHLDCGFRPSTARVLTVALTVHHAQYVSATLVEE